MIPQIIHFFLFLKKLHHANQKVLRMKPIRFVLVYVIMSGFIRTMNYIEVNKEPLGEYLSISMWLLVTIVLFGNLVIYIITGNKLEREKLFLGCVDLVSILAMKFFVLMWLGFFSLSLAAADLIADALLILVNYVYESRFIPSMETIVSWVSDLIPKSFKRVYCSVVFLIFNIGKLLHIFITTIFNFIAALRLYCKLADLIFIKVFIIYALLRTVLVTTIPNIYSSYKNR